MATNQLSQVIQTLRSATHPQEGAGLSDGQLLESYLTSREEAAFAALVHRHGPMVWGVCRRVLGSHHDAEDAFQATFLVLVRKAAGVVPREMVANWLYGVAHQTALKARATTAKRRAREKQVMAMPEPVLQQQDLLPEQSGPPHRLSLFRHRRGRLSKLKSTLLAPWRRRASAVPYCKPRSSASALPDYHSTFTDDV